MSDFFFARSSDLGTVQKFRKGWQIAGTDGTGIFVLIEETGQARGFFASRQLAEDALARLDPGAIPAPTATAPETAPDAPDAPDGTNPPAPKGRARKAPATAPEAAPKSRKARAAKPVDAPAPGAA